MVRNGIATFEPIYRQNKHLLATVKPSLQRLRDETDAPDGKVSTPKNPMLAE